MSSRPVSLLASALAALAADALMPPEVRHQPSRMTRIEAEWRRRYGH